MKKSVIGLLLIALISSVVAVAGLTTLPTSAPAVAATSPADPYISQGKFYLVTHNILAAREQFRQGVVADAANQEANLLYGITRIFALYEDSQTPTAGLDSIREILELSGFTFQTFGLYDTKSTATDILPASTPRTGEILDFLKTKVLPEVDAAIANFAVVTDPTFSSVITPAAIGATSGNDLNIDYADALVIKSLLNALKCNINLLLVYNMDVSIPDIQSSPEQLMTYKALFQNAAFLTVKDAARLTTAKTALLGFIDTYNLAAPLLLSRVGNANHLFVVDVPVTNEPFDLTTADINDVTSTLADLKTSLSGPKVFNSSDPQESLTVDLSRFFNAAAPINIRAQLGNCSTGTAFPDSTIGGLLPLSFPAYADLLAKAGPHMLGVVCSGREVPRISVEPDTFMLSYDPSYPYPPNSYTSKPVTIGNNGTASLHVTATSLLGVNAGAFTVSAGTCSSTTPTVAPGQSCAVNVALKEPFVNYGILSAQLDVASDDSTQPNVGSDIMGWVQPPPGGVISGVVRDAKTMTGIQSVLVSVFSQDGWQYASVYTDSSGMYTISGLQSGSYKIHYESFNGVYLNEWYNNKADFNSADVVVLTPAALPLGETLLSTPDLSVITAGSGEGTVNSMPTGIACASGATANCGPLAFPVDTDVILTATASTNSTFGGWSGACTNSSGACTVRMNAPKNVTATFIAAPKAKVGETGFSSIQAAYNAAAGSNALIKLLEGTQIENPVFNLSKTVTLAGGYNSLFGITGNGTTIDGTLTLRAGTVRVKGVNVK